MLTLNFTKVEGTGNDFILLHEAKFDRTDRKFVSVLCDRHYGIGADGVILLTRQANSNNVSWDFFNSDGSTAEMCGNAARAVGAYGKLKYGLDELFLKTTSGEVHISNQRMPAGWYSVSLQMPQIIEANLSAHGGLLQAITTQLGIDTVSAGALIQSGVPHLVVHVEGFQGPTEVYRQMCQRLRTGLTQKGISTNITLVGTSKNGVVPVCSFERGVEDFTLSCGTGALAVAGFMHIDALRELSKNTTNQQQLAKINCAMPGGRLEVDFSLNERRAQLSGPAKVVFQGEISV